MQTGSVKRHGRGWRGYWREPGRSRATKTMRTKGEAHYALNVELERLHAGDRWSPRSCCGSSPSGSSTSTAHHRRPSSMPV